MARRGRKGKGLRGLIRSAYRMLGCLNTAAYIMDAPAHPERLAKHLARRKVAKFGGKLIK